MLNKTKIIIAAASVLITGIGAGTGTYIATRNNNTAASASSEVIMASSKTESATTSAIDTAVSAGIERIQSETQKAIQQIQSAASEAAPSGVQSRTSELTSSAKPEPAEFTLNVEAKRGNGKLTFKKFETVPDKNEVIFYYEPNDQTRLMPDVSRVLLVDKNGNRYTKSDNFYEGSLKGYLHFQNITDYSDLSHVTLTYAFEGFDPVTVTFDIPLQ